MSKPIFCNLMRKRQGTAQRHLFHLFPSSRTQNLLHQHVFLIGKTNMAIGAIQTSVLQTDAHPVLIHTGRFTLSLMYLCRIGQRFTRHKLRISLSAKEPSPVKKLQQEVRCQEEDTSPKHRKQPVCPAQQPVTTDRGESHRLQFAISAYITDADAVGTCQRQGIGQTNRLIPTRQPQPQADSRSISRFFPHYLLPTMVQTICRHRTFHHQISMVNADTPIPTNVVTIFFTRNLIIQASLRRTYAAFISTATGIFPVSRTSSSRRSASVRVSPIKVL